MPQQLFLNPEIAAWAGDDPFARAQQQQGKIFRAVENRRTLRFKIGANRYFLKLHCGVGWREIFKNLAHGKLPVTGADNEWRALAKLNQLNVPTMRAVAFGRRGVNPATRVSFLITEELRDTISLSAVCADWQTHPPSVGFKRAVINRVAELARALHDGGVNHRDFYLCHLFADVSMGRENLTRANLRLSVMDLHRAQTRKKTPRRWRVKDIGGLYFSALELNLARNDLLRFMRAYRGQPLRQVQADAKFWRQAAARARRIQRRNAASESRQ